MAQFTPPEIWKYRVVMFGIHDKNFNTKILHCLGLSLKTEQRIRKELNESSGDYTTAWKPHFARSDKKRNPEFFVRSRL